MTGRYRTANDKSLTTAEDAEARRSAEEESQDQLWISSAFLRVSASCAVKTCAGEVFCPRSL